MLKVVFIGDGELGAALLNGVLATSHGLLGVVNRIPLRGLKKWRRRAVNILNPDNAEKIIRAHKLLVLTTAGANSEDFRAKVAALAPDVLLMGSWGEILREPTIRLPKLACINCHPALLPAHRGGNPFASVLVAGEKKTGVTFHLVNEKIDAGAILLQKEIEITTDDTPATLKAKCARTAQAMVPELLDQLEKGQLQPRPQDEARASYYRAFTLNDGAINWTLSAAEIHQRIRGLTPDIICHTCYRGARLRIGASRIVQLDVPSSMPGQILGKSGNSILVATGDPGCGVMVEISGGGKFARLMGREIRVGSLLDSSART